MFNFLRIRNWSIGTKITVLNLVLSLLIVAILFGLYAIKTRKGTIDTLVDKAKTLTVTAESARDEMEAKWDLGVFTQQYMREMAKKGDKEKLVAVIPVVSAWRTIMMKAKEGGYKFKAPKVSPRNPANEPDAIENRVLAELKSKNLNQTYVIDKKNNTVRYFRAVRLSKSCLLCHGDPATSKELWGNDKGLDPTGAKMEDWKEGEIHGAFEIIQSLDQADQTMRRDLWLAGLVALGALLIGLLVSWVIGRGMSRPIKSTVGILDAAAKGDFTAEIDESFKRRGDEIGHMIESLGEMAQKLSGSLGANVSASQDLAEGASRQAAALEESSASLEELNSMTKMNTDNARKANQLSNESGAVVNKANESMKDLRNAMDSITAASDEMAKIIRTIDEIAFQTNLLALNAAVEAARAGEAGAGFAVVADEVRSLAIRAADAAKNTSDLIEDNITNIKRSSDLVTATDESFTQVVESVNRVSNLMDEISAASDEQSEGINQITLAVNEMDEVTQSNAATAEEMAASMATFKLRKDGSAPRNEKDQEEVDLLDYSGDEDWK